MFEFSLPLEVVKTIVCSLKNTKQDLEFQIKKNEPRKADMCKSQLLDIEYALSFFNHKLFKGEE